MRAFSPFQKSGLWHLAADAVIITGTFYWNWSVVRPLLYYMLDLAVMVIFVVFLLKKLSGRPWDGAMVMAVPFLWFFLFLVYWALLVFASHVEPGVWNGGFFFSVFEPYYQLIPVLLFMGIGHFEDYRYFMADQDRSPAAYLKVFLFRMIVIWIVMFLADVLDTVHRVVQWMPLFIIIAGNHTINYLFFAANKR